MDLSTLDLYSTLTQLSRSLVLYTVTGSLVSLEFNLGSRSNDLPQYRDFRVTFVS